MKIYYLHRKQVLHGDLSEVWSFFSSPHNLKRITPPSMDFNVTSELPEGPVFEGMRIEYRIKPLLNIPVKWVTLIADVKAPYLFTDIQEEGPYAVWEHTHRFEETPYGVEMTDEVKYALPLGLAGRLAHQLFIKNELEKIFNYRHNIITTIFTKSDGNPL